MFWFRHIFIQARSYLQGLPFKPGMAWSKLFPNADPRGERLMNFTAYLMQLLFGLVVMKRLFLLMQPISPSFFSKLSATDQFQIWRLTGVKTCTLQDFKLQYLLQNGSNNYKPLSALSYQLDQSCCDFGHWFLPEVLISNDITKSWFPFTPFAYRWCYFSLEKNISVEKLISTFLEFQRETVEAKTSLKLDNSCSENMLRSIFSWAS